MNSDRNGKYLACANYKGCVNVFDLKKLKSKSVINKYINSIWTHLQANFCHNTLGSKILVQQYGPIKHYPGKSIKKVSGINGLEGMESITEKNLGKANLMLYVAVDRGCKLVSI